MHAAVLVCGTALQELAVGGVQVLLPEEVILLEATQLLFDARGHICGSMEYQLAFLQTLFMPSKFKLLCNGKLAQNLVNFSG